MSSHVPKRLPRTGVFHHDCTFTASTVSISKIPRVAYVEIEDMGTLSKIQGWALAISLVAGCNMVTGAGDIELVDGDDGEGAGADSTTGPTTGAGPTGATSGTGGATSGPGATTGNGSTAGSGGASTSSGMNAASTGSNMTTTGGGENCGGSGAGTTPLDAEEQAFLDTLNNYRAQNGLGPVDACVSLNRTAQGHSEDMRDNDYFSHDGQNGSEPWDRACDACFDLGCGPSTAMAENIAAGNSGAAGTFEQWRTSPGHNQNMLGSNFTMIGIGRATGGGMYGTYWTTVFAGTDEPSCY